MYLSPNFDNGGITLRWEHQIAGTWIVLAFSLYYPDRYNKGILCCSSLRSHSMQNLSENACYSDLSGYKAVGAARLASSSRLGSQDNLLVREEEENYITQQTTTTTEKISHSLNEPSHLRSISGYSNTSSAKVSPSFLEHDYAFVKSFHFFHFFFLLFE